MALVLGTRADGSVNNPRDGGSHSFEQVILASATYTTSPPPIFEVTNRVGYEWLIFLINLSAVTSTNEITMQAYPFVAALDDFAAPSGNNSMFSSFTDITEAHVGTRIFNAIIGPGATNSLWRGSGPTAASGNGPLPPRFKVHMLHGEVNSVTYSISALMGIGLPMA